jgi:hypothetical protein
VNFQYGGGFSGFPEIFSIDNAAGNAISLPNGLASFASSGNNVSAPIVIDFIDSQFATLPTRVGIVFTDSSINNPFTMTAFSASGVVVDTATINTANASPFPSDDDTEDTFIGMQSSAGISKVELSTVRYQNDGIRGWEVDDLRFNGVLGVPPAPEVEVRGNNVVINDNDTTPSTSDHTDFGSVAVGSTISRTFTVRNTGTAALSTSNLRVLQTDSTSGATTTLFAITEGLSSSIAPGASDTFTLRFTPTSAGDFTRFVYFANNDSNENPYNFAVRGRATGSTPAVGSISGRVWNDTDGDGTLDSGETGRSGVNVYLDLNDNRVKDAGEPSVNTDSSGNYSFANLSARRYVVRQIVPSGFTQTSPAGGFGHSFDLAAGQSVTGKNFGLRQAAPTWFNLSNNVLTITGTNNADFIRGFITNNVLTMRLNGLSQTFNNASSISRIVVNALGGNDSVIFAPSMNRPTSLFGGDGNDTLIGGSANDVVNGGNGSDFAVRNNAGDTFSSIEELIA